MKILGNILKHLRSSHVNRIPAKDGMKSLLDKNVASLFDESLSNRFSELLTIAEGHSSGSQKAYYSMLDDIIHKLKMCPDEKVKEAAMKLIHETEGKSKEDILVATREIETLLDSVNVAEGKYSTLFIASMPLENEYLEMKKIKWFMKIQSIRVNIAQKLGNKKKAEKIAAKLYKTYSEPRQAYYALRRSGRVKEAESPEFDLASRFSRMIEYFVYAPEESEMANYLYKNYYIEKIRKNEIGDLVKSERNLIVKLLDKINKKFNTKVFLDEIDIFTATALQELRNEFNIWRKASGGEAKFPIVYKSSKYTRPAMINGRVEGDCSQKLKAIRVKNIEDSGEKRGFHVTRHEMLHLNDKRFCKKLCEKKVNIPKYQRLEMAKAGIAEWHIEYAKSDIFEKAAVLCEGQTSKYSQEFKDAVINVDGMEKYMTELPTHSEFFEQILRKKYSENSDIQTIENIKSAFDGEIPMYVIETLLKNRRMLTVADEVIKEYGSKYEYCFPFITACQSKLAAIDMQERMSRVTASCDDLKTQLKEFAGEVETLRSQINEEMEILDQLKIQNESQNVKPIKTSISDLLNGNV